MSSLQIYFLASPLRPEVSRGNFNFKYYSTVSYTFASSPTGKLLGHLRFLWLGINSFRYRISLPKVAKQASFWFSIQPCGESMFHATSSKSSKCHTSKHSPAKLLNTMMPHLTISMPYFWSQICIDYWHKFLRFTAQICVVVVLKMCWKCQVVVLKKSVCKYIVVQLTPLIYTPLF